MDLNTASELDQLGTELHNLNIYLQETQQMVWMLCIILFISIISVVLGMCCYLRAYCRTEKKIDNLLQYHEMVDNESQSVKL